LGAATARNFVARAPAHHVLWLDRMEKPVDKKPTRPLITSTTLFLAIDQEARVVTDFDDEEITQPYPMRQVSACGQ
jgi:hypothetical protein